MSLTRLHLLTSRVSLFPVSAKSVLLGVILFISLLGIQAASTREHDAQVTSSAENSSTQPTQPPAADVAPTPVADPLNSSHPIPWGWIVDMQSQSESLPAPEVRYYRSQSLVSPNGTHAAYSRIQMELSPEPTQHQVSSMLFLENLDTGDLQFVTASSPFVRNPNVPVSEYRQPGMIAILLPLTWTENGDRLLVRGFESRFGTDLASDYAVVWDQATNVMQAIVPRNIQYSNAVLLGWSQTNPGQVLFRAGDLGDESWPMLAVDFNGQAIASAQDEPLVYGQLTDTDWNGPQASYTLPSSEL